MPHASHVWAQQHGHPLSCPLEIAWCLPCLLLNVRPQQTLESQPTTALESKHSLAAPFPPPHTYPPWHRGRAVINLERKQSYNNAKQSPVLLLVYTSYPFPFHPSTHPSLLDFPKASCWRQNINCLELYFCSNSKRLIARTKIEISLMTFW